MVVCSIFNGKSSKGKKTDKIYLNKYFALLLVIVTGRFNRILSVDESNKILD